MKQIIDLSSLDEIERSLYLDDTWCDNCSEADLGIGRPELYIENNRKFISGSCNVCGELCTSEIITKNIT
jgi:hypothetical protein